MGCGDGTSAHQPTTTFFSYKSGAGDPVGGGTSNRYTLADANNWLALYDGTQHVRIFIGRTGSWSWALDFAGPQGHPLTAGQYDGAARYPFQSPTQPGLSAIGSGPGCNTITGYFSILNLVVGTADSLAQFHATFTQRCDNAPATLTGEISIVADPWR